MTVPNLLTGIRIGLAPVFAATYAASEGPAGAPWLLYLSAGIFALAFSLDILDGLLARVLHQSTGLGALLDPLADKLLIATALVLLVAYDGLPVWVVGVVIGRDAVMWGGWSVLRRSGRAPEISPSRVGRTALAFQVVAIVATMIGLPAAIWWAFWVIAIALTLVAGVGYAAKGVRQLRGRTRSAGSSESSQVA